ncbi:nucleotide exchange factor GrpE [Brachybacterium nesterenkovii]|uniref:Protein GrpE n=1 Tax=Brachybacterium nesterenkovii TaxID=47847 RepID=A0A1X6X045_9MICO|nr:nucleotide exchange factor GrpE [Brachybacterium nesterenkovii]SLM91828.1 Heat shock protein GrpE [Brachybacterium nesterenkovii]
MTENAGTNPQQEPRDGSAEGQGGSFSFADKRRVDPTDGTVRPSGPAAGEQEQPEGAASADDASAPSQGAEGVDPIDAEAAELFAEAEQGETPGAASDARVAELEGRVAELQEELKRAQAEYVNSRRRIEASAQVGTETAVAGVLSSLIGVLDDVELGRQHGDIAEGTPFASIASKLEDALRAHGMERFGAEGEAFDPTIHEALMHEDSDEVEVAEIKTVLQRGYRMKERVLRPARVATRGPQ